MIRMSALGQPKPSSGAGIPWAGKAMDITLMGEKDQCRSKHRQHRQ